MSNSPASLVKLFSDHWDAYMRWDPIYATMCGDHRFDDQLGSADESHYTDWLNQLRGFQKRLEKIDSSKLDDFLTGVQKGYRNNPYHNALHGIDVMHSVAMYIVHTNLSELACFHPIDI